MPYTVKQLAKLSGVSPRTLRFYDEIQLLKPARYGNNAYRYYDEEQLLLLQQILFFRELGFPLKDIKSFMSNPGFDKIETLAMHKLSLKRSLDKTRTLIQTIDKTISHLKGEKLMPAENLYDGLQTNIQKVLQDYSTAVNQFYVEQGMSQEDLEAMAQAQEKIKDWSMDEFEKINAFGKNLLNEFVNLIEKQVKVESQKTQALVAKHYDWCTQLNGHLSKPGYQIIFSQSLNSNQMKNYYQQFHPELMNYFFKAIKVFCQ